MYEQALDSKAATVTATTRDRAVTGVQALQAELGMHTDDNQGRAGDVFAAAEGAAGAHEVSFQEEIKHIAENLLQKNEREAEAEAEAAIDESIQKDLEISQLLGVERGTFINNEDCDASGDDVSGHNGDGADDEDEDDGFAYHGMSQETLDLLRALEKKYPRAYESPSVIIQSTKDIETQMQQHLQDDMYSSSQTESK